MLICVSADISVSTDLVIGTFARGEMERNQEAVLVLHTTVSSQPFHLLSWRSFCRYVSSSSSISPRSPLFVWVNN